MPDVEGMAAAQQAVTRNVSPRYAEIDNLERYVTGRAYDGRPDWFNATGVPLWERKPCIVYPVVRQAIQSNTDLTMGQGRFPHLTTNPGEDDGDADDEETKLGPDEVAGYDEEESEELDHFLAELSKRVSFPRVCRKAFASAQALKSACAILGVRAGRLRVDVIKAHWCTPTLDPTDGSVLFLEIRYPYLQTRRDRDGKWRVVAKLYRRTIDAVQDVTYYPADAHADGAEPVWVANPTLTFPHGFGFCPVHWYAHMLECGAANEIDGHAIHEQALDQVFAHDVALSMRHRAAITLGDPQPYETGVDPGYNPVGGTVRPPRIPATAKGGAPTGAAGTNPVAGAFEAATTLFGSARPKGPAHVWQYPAPDAKVAYLTLPADAFTPISEHAQDLRIKVCEALGVVFLDPEHIKFASSLSGKALDILRERQLNRCDQYREDFGEGFIQPVLGMLLRVVLHFDVGVPGSATARPLLARHWDDATARWLGPVVTLKWPDYFKPDPEEEQATVTAVSAAMLAGACSRRTAVERLRRFYPVENVTQALAAVDGDPGKLGDAMAKAALSGLLESETYRREISKRFMRAILPGLDPALADKIDAEVDTAPVEPLAVPGAPGGGPLPTPDVTDEKGAPASGKDKAA